MRKFLNFRIIDVKGYWEARKLMAKTQFSYRANKHVVKEGVRRGIDDTRSLIVTLKSTLLSIAIAAITVGALVAVDHLAAPKLENWGWKFPSDADYITFLAAVAGMGGVFIGLYYAALTSVGSAIYAKVPNNIRVLLARERSGSVYMRFLSTLTVLCVMLIALRLVGLSKILVAIPLIAVLAGMGVIAFVRLGKTAFNFFPLPCLTIYLKISIRRFQL
ncbi:hypothetical protein [Pseudomonas multiresinivorans]|uniref:Uncharacterized protein n=1 Tax=Pseudomonas multiresinivorans TaxID=95301 RepID=A0A7Z3GRN2_9PSED|nr:hypothetical protein [Pseudomonas multiresinivorans]QJP09350.1 hypothetical protein G4G71_16200 [Pseudomonas multiresinivorans]